jgi:serine/threonine protein kinase/HEAT repeat protein
MKPFFQLLCRSCGDVYEAEHLELGSMPDCVECGNRLVLPGKTSLLCQKCGFRHVRDDLPVNPMLPCPECGDPLFPEEQQCGDLLAAKSETVLPETPSSDPGPDDDPLAIPLLSNETIGLLGTHPPPPKKNTPSKPDPKSGTDPNRTKILSLERPADDLQDIERTRRVDGPVAMSGGIAAGTFGKYTVKREIARGGMGIVYQVYDPDLRRDLALKVLIEGEGAREEVLKRFLREARASANLRHPNIIAVHEMGQIDGQFYFTMDYIIGRSFRDIIEERGSGKPAMSALDFIRHMRDVCSALETAHDAGIYHRDLKPANIMLQEETQRVILMDFGLAKDTSSMTIVSMTGQVFGSPAYMSPEQAQGLTRVVDHRSDIYSMGVILYEGLTAVQPFFGETIYDTISNVVNSEPVPPRNLNPTDIDVALQNVILKCLEKDPEKRYQKIHDLIADLDAYLSGGPVAARAIPFLVRAWRKAKKHPVITATAALAIVIAVTFLVGRIVFSKPSYVKIAQRAIAGGDLKRQAGALQELVAQLAEGGIRSDTERAEARRILRDFLRSEHGDLVRIAVESCRDGADPLALSDLIAACGNAKLDADVRLAAIEYTATTGRKHPSADAPWIAALLEIGSAAGEPQNIRCACMDSLGETASPLIIPAALRVAENTEEPTPVRTAALRLLGKRVAMGHPAMENLIRLYGDADETVSKAAGDALKNARQKEGIFGLYGISTGVANVYKNAAEVELLNQKRNRELAGLMEEVDLSPAEKRQQEEESKKQEKPPYEVIVAKLGESDPDIRMTAAYDLAAIGDGRAVPELQKLLNRDEDTRVITVAARSILELAPSRRPDIHSLYKLLENNDNLILREQAALLLGRLEGRRATPRLVNLSRIEDSRRVQSMLVRIFAEIRDPESLQPLVAMAVRNETRNPAIASDCIRAIASFGKEAVPYLVKALLIEDPGIRNLCLDELRDLSGEDHGNDPDAWRKWSEKPQP